MADEMDIGAEKSGTRPEAPPSVDVRELLEKVMAELSGIEKARSHQLYEIKERLRSLEQDRDAGFERHLARRLELNKPGCCSINEATSDPLHRLRNLLRR